MDMYFMAIVLPEELDKKVLSYKQFMLKQFNCKVGLKSPAHITLIPPFWMNREKEQVLLDQLDILCRKEKGFTITTKNFSAFKPRTIFIDVEMNAALGSLKKSVDHFFLEYKEFGAKIETRPFRPHITIATRDLHKKAFAEAWPYFEKKEYATSFLASGLCILRHNKVNWDIIHIGLFSPE